MAFTSPRVRRKNRLMIFTVFILFTSTSGQPSDQYDLTMQKVKIPYAFSYGIEDAHQGPNFQQAEESDGELVVGSYSVQLPDGRTQTVRYKADHIKGFTADVSYNGEAKYPPPSQDPPFIAKPNTYPSDPAMPYKRDIPSDDESPGEPVQPFVAFQHEDPTKKKVIKMEPIYLRTSTRRDQGAHDSKTVYDNVRAPQTSNMFIRADKLNAKSQHLDNRDKQDINYVHPQERQQNIYDYILPPESDDSLSVDSQKSQPKSQIQNYKIYSFLTEAPEGLKLQNHGNRKKMSSFQEDSINLEEKIAQTVTNSNTEKQQNIKKKIQPYFESQIQVTEIPSLDSKTINQKSMTEMPLYVEKDFASHKFNSEKEASKTVPFQEPSEEKILQQLVKRNQHLVTSDPLNTKQLNKPKKFVPSTIRPRTIKVKTRRKNLKDQNRESPDSVNVEINPTNLELSADEIYTT